MALSEKLACPTCRGSGEFTPPRQTLCRECGQWHDHTGRSMIAMRDWRGTRWPIHPGTMPRNNGDDSGGREYGPCQLGARG